MYRRAIEPATNEQEDRRDESWCQSADANVQFNEMHYIIESLGSQVGFSLLLFSFTELQAPLFFPHSGCYLSPPIHRILVTDSIEFSNLPDGIQPGHAQIPSNKLKSGDKDHHREY